MRNTFRFLSLLALGLTQAACGGIQGVGVPGGLNARRVELAQPVVQESVLHHDVRYQANEIVPSPNERYALRDFLTTVGASNDDFLAVAVEPAATAQLTLERQRQLVALLQGWGFRASGSGTGTAGGFGQTALVLVHQVRLLEPEGCIADSAAAVIARENEVAMSRFGCSTAYNLGLMVADPRDLTGSQGYGDADGARAAFLLREYRAREAGGKEQATAGIATTGN